jgi:hypothetical protein
MSFDVYLQRFEGGEPAEADRASVLAALRTVKHTDFDEFGFSIVTFEDGVEVEFSAGGLDSNESFTHCAFHIRDLSDKLVKFVFDIAKAGDMVVIPIMEDATVGLVGDAQQNQLPQEMRGDFKVARLQSAQELGLLLKGGFETWVGYRADVHRRLDL